MGGSSLAASIAKHGARVLLLEREPQFKDRVRGECVFPWGVAEAIQLDILELLRGRCAHELAWMDFYSGDVLTAHRPVAATTPQQLPCIAFYHPTMQELLLGAAASAGVCVRRGVSVKEVRPGNPPTVIVGDNGHHEEIRARLVVGADGRSSCARSSAGFQLRRDPENMLLAGVLLDDVGAPEDTGQIVFNYSSGELAILLPQGGRARPHLLWLSRRRPASLSGHSRPSEIPRELQEIGDESGVLCRREGGRAAGDI
ncbi:MAG: FAD-dependent monooxygenase [Terriglobales bacterium]